MIIIGIYKLSTITPISGRDRPAERSAGTLDYSITTRMRIYIGKPRSTYLYYDGPPSSPADRSADGPGRRPPELRGGQSRLKSIDWRRLPVDPRDFRVTDPKADRETSDGTRRRIAAFSSGKNHAAERSVRQRLGIPAYRRVRVADEERRRYVY